MAGTIQSYLMWHRLTLLDDGETVQGSDRGLSDPTVSVLPDSDAISVMKAGKLRFSKPNKYWVESSQKRYVLFVEDSILGIVVDPKAENFLIDIKGPALAFLPVLAFERGTRRNIPKFEELCTLIYVGIVKGMNLEFSCTDGCRWEAVEFGVLNDGYTFEYSTGLSRMAEEMRKSCRLRWMNYLSPSVKRDNFSEEEDDLIIRLHKLLGNRWSLIAGRVPGRTDNQVKNYWNTHLSKRLGVKKGKCKACAPSPGSSRELRNYYSNASSSSKYATNPASTAEVTGLNAVEGGSKSELELASRQGMTMGDWDDNSFLFLNNDDPNLFTPNLMEFVDESVDFVWYDF
ncbi:hypothetical protein GH714_040723 [Hevea brasiliensis]|uniref:Uncharacterized protein n=1 Tax=Hevea brasiliensis TaxID=3981 RepID=A0A6A6MU18_HEVBR|nr:hypothetical protein GH714_040723 [Hevea brasiliensis]